MIHSIELNLYFPYPRSMNTDVEDVKFVINFDYPNNSEEYIHRIGRTGRSNNTGTAYTLFTIQNASKASDLVNVLSEANQVSQLRFIKSKRKKNCCALSFRLNVN